MESRTKTKTGRDGMGNGETRPYCGQPSARPSSPSPPEPSPPDITNASVLGTIASTIGIAMSMGGKDKKAPATAPPPPVAKDTSINTGNKDEDDLWVSCGVWR